jgi:flagellar hook assembly protein FlgD
MNMAPSHIALKLADAGVAGTSDLEQNVPNPFVVSVTGQTTIGFNLASAENVTLRVFDVLGHEIRTLIAGEGRTAGYNTVQWDGRDGSGNVVGDGLYYYQLTTPDFTQCEKMQVVR